MEHAELEDIAVAYIVIFDKPIKLNLASIRDESSFMKVSSHDSHQDRSEDKQPLIYDIKADWQRLKVLDVKEAALQQAFGSDKDYIQITDLGIHLSNFEVACEGIKFLYYSYLNSSNKS